MNNPDSKIPCSVSLLTLNSQEGLSACLVSLQNFAEIIVCDGNSIDGTRAVAQKYGARVISQYDTDEPNTPCAMDKASRRARAMDSSTLPWRFFMDADDELSLETVAEIERIVSNPNPTHLVWRMPTRIFIDGKEIAHEATYPSYQTRLVHSSVGAGFRGHVHDRLDFDAKKFPVGTMQNYYDFHWSAARVSNYWGYLGTYAKREIKVAEYGSFLSVLYWDVYRRTKTIMGYLLWRLPSMYARWGFRNSMPLSIELTIVRYHLFLLGGHLYNYVRTRLWCELLVETLRGKDLYRILTNVSLRTCEAYGRVLDVGGGDGRASYWRYLQTRRWHNVTTLDVSAANKPKVVLDLETQTLPFADRYFDTILLCNVLEHLELRSKIVAELKRVLQAQGTVVGIIPFLVAVHKDPHDYVRLTDEGLRALFLKAGFSHIDITPVGRGPLVASYYQSEFLLPRILKIIVLPFVLVLDKIVVWVRPGLREKFPLAYQFQAKV